MPVKRKGYPLSDDPGPLCPTPDKVLFHERAIDEGRRTGFGRFADKREIRRRRSGANRTVFTVADKEGDTSYNYSSVVCITYLTRYFYAFCSSKSGNNIIGNVPSSRSFPGNTSFFLGYFFLLVPQRTRIAL